MAYLIVQACFDASGHRLSSLSEICGANRPGTAIAADSHGYALQADYADQPNGL